ncbi:MAG: uncharacterized protein A8A55_3212, partial [Amphiamblys sp. WSBS2006]
MLRQRRLRELRVLESPRPSIKQKTEETTFTSEERKETEPGGAEITDNETSHTATKTNRPDILEVDTCDEIERNAHREKSVGHARMTLSRRTSEDTFVVHPQILFRCSPK